MLEVIPNIAHIPRGNTCPGVNRTIIEYLISHSIDLDTKTVLDIPCGNGVFLDSIKEFFSTVHTIGADIRRPSRFGHEFHQFDAHKPFEFRFSTKCDLVTCISGVMEFDNTLGFFRELDRITNSDAVIIITNDNVATARDRILYFLFGRFGQYKTIPEKRGPTWKILHLADLERILSEAGFKVRDVRYVVGNWTAWLWLPLALPLYAAQFLYFLFAERSITFADKRRSFPLASTVARHYLFVCEKDNRVEEGETVEP